MHSTASSSSAPPPPADSPTASPPPPTLQTLPPEVISKIALSLFSLTPLGPPTDARSLCLTSRRLNAVLSHRNNPSLYASLFPLQFDIRAPRRRFHPSDARFHAENVGSELRSRWAALSRIRQIGGGGGGCRPNSTTEESDIQRDAYFSIGQDLISDLWTIYVLLIENDGLNLLQLERYALLGPYMSVVWAERLLKPVLEPYLPEETVDRALALWIEWFLCTEPSLLAEPVPEAEKNLFALRPYALAAHQYEAFYAPWYETVMPLDPRSSPSSSLPRCTIDYFGSPLPLAPPKAALAAIMLFSLRRAVRPDATGQARDTAVGHPNGPAPAMQGQQGEEFEYEGRPPFAGEVEGGRGSGTWDMVWRRQVRCWDPRAGRGLGLGDTDVNGVWEGTFAFFEFDAYREMLFGSSRAVYDSAFASQAQVWRMRAAPARLTDTDKAHILEGRRRRAAGAGQETMETEEWVWGDEQVALDGTGHSSWGTFTLKGCVRTWDGLIQFQKDYVPAGSRGAWLYRGYLVGDKHLVGRWRDTFTEKTQDGYEGIFAMARRE